jgi:hypothetical protein
MKNPTCETCPYWDEHADASRDECGQCKKNSPVVVSQSDHEWQDDEDDEGFMAVWPHTLSNFWCAEHPDFKRPKGGKR